MNEMVRVKDKQTGDEYTARRPDLDKVDVLDDKPAADAYGRALPAKHNKTSAARKNAAAKKKDPNPGGEPATTDPKEGS